MRGAQILLLIAAGALGGAIVTKVWQKPKTPATPLVAEQTTTPVIVPAPASEPAAAPLPAPAPEPVPVEPEAVKPSPVAPPKSRAVEDYRATVRHEAPKPGRTVRTSPPPANPRPVELGARVVPHAEPPPTRLPAAQPTPPVVQETPAPVISTPPARPEPEHMTPAPPPPPPAPNRVTLNTGVLLPVRLIDGLSSERNIAGDTFTATLDRPLVVDGFVIAERGARVDGRVANVDRGGKVRGVSSMAIELTRLHTSDGQTVAIQTDGFKRDAEPTHGTDAAKVGGGAALGAIIGAIAGGGKGAAIGAGVGGGAGAGDVLLTRGRPVTFPTETRVSFRLRAAVTVTERR